MTRPWSESFILPEGTADTYRRGDGQNSRGAYREDDPKLLSDIYWYVRWNQRYQAAWVDETEEYQKSFNRSLFDFDAGDLLVSHYPWTRTGSAGESCQYVRPTGMGDWDYSQISRWALDSDAGMRVENNGSGLLLEQMWTRSFEVDEEAVAVANTGRKRAVTSYFIDFPLPRMAKLGAKGEGDRAKQKTWIPLLFRLRYLRFLLFKK